MLSLVYTNQNGQGLLGATTALTNVSRTWLLNDIGTATMSLSLSLPNIEWIAALGAIHRIYDDEAPPWVGYVETREWKGGMVTLSLRSAEGLLRGKLTSQSLVLGADGLQTVGTIAFNVFVSGVLRNSDSPLRAGVFNAPGPRFVELSYADVYETFVELANGYEAAFWVDDNLLTYFMTSRGADKRESVLLADGRNASIRARQSIEGTRNAIVGLGEGSDVRARPKKALRSFSDYGFWAEVVTLQGAIDPATTEVAARDTLFRLRVPTNTFDCALRGNPNVAVCDIVSVVPSTAPWATSYVCRCVGLEINTSGERRVLLEEVPPARSVAHDTWVLT